MRHALLACLAILAATAAFAQAPPEKDEKALAGYWTRMPKEARLAYMVGATSGLLAFCDAQPGCQGTPSPRIDRVLDAMDRLTADETVRPLPMMAVAAAALAMAQDQDPMPALRVGREMVGEATLQDIAPAPVQPAPSAAPPHKSRARKAGQ